MVFREECLSYSRLNAEANRLAAYLKELGAGRGSVVGVMVKRGLMMPVSALAVLKTGAAYLPLDPGYPADRLQYMLEDAGARILVCDGDLRDRVPD